MWNAQEAFNATCSGGLTVGQWCATSHDVCCGLCQNIPITGPGTFLGTVLGSIILLGFARTWKTETPYTLGFQLLSADGAVVGLLHRFLEPKNRLTLFHYSFVPLTVISSVPIIVACCIARLPYLHGVSSGDIRVRLLAEKHPDFRHDGGQTEERPPSRARSAPALGHRPEHDMRSLWKKKKGVARRNSTESLHPEEYPGDALVRFVLWATTLHLAFFSLVFIMVYGFMNEETTAQANCNKVHDLHVYRVVGGIISAVFIVVAWFFLGCAWIAKKSDSKIKLDALDVILNWAERGFQKLAGRHARLVRRTKYKRTLRWVIPLSLWALWLSAYATIYVTAGNRFLMQGNNMWPFEQINAPFGILVPCVLFFRGVMCRLDLRNGKPDFEKAEKELRAALKKYRRQQSGRPDPHGEEHLPPAVRRRSTISSTRQPSATRSEPAAHSNGSSDTDSLYRASSRASRRSTQTSMNRGDRTDSAPAHHEGDAISSVDTDSSSSSDTSHRRLHGLRRRGSRGF